MAYLDLNAGYPFAVAGVAPAAERKLEAQERLVVLLSRTDPLWSLTPRHHRSRLMSLLFDIRPPQAFADARLRALRRYAVTYRERDAGVAAAEQGAREVGYGEGQLRQVRTIVDGARAVRPRHGFLHTVRQAVLALAGVLILYGAAAWLSPRFDSGLMAFVFVAVAALSIAPFAGRREPAR